MLSSSATTWAHERIGWEEERPSLAAGDPYAAKATDLPGLADERYGDVAIACVRLLPLLDQTDTQPAASARRATCSLAIDDGSRTAGLRTRGSSPPARSTVGEGDLLRVGDRDLLAADASALGSGVSRVFIRFSHPESLFAVAVHPSTGNQSSSRGRSGSPSS